MAMLSVAAQDQNQLSDYDYEENQTMVNLQRQLQNAASSQQGTQLSQTGVEDDEEDDIDIDETAVKKDDEVWFFCKSKGAQQTA